MSQTQSALIIPERFGAFKLEQVPIYTPGPGQLLIKIYAGALNPADWKMQKYAPEQLLKTYPIILGIDRAGEVLEIGEGVEGFNIGDRVLSTPRFFEYSYSGFQQYAVTDAIVTTKIPSNLSYEEAATIPLCLATAFSGLFAEFPYGAGLPAPFTPGGQNVGVNKSIFIVGGSSSLGQFAIQLAKLSGFSKIITTASLRNESLLKSQGATHVIDRALEISEIVEQILTITSGRPVEFTIDAIGVPPTESLGIAVASHWHEKSGEKGLFVSCHPHISESLKSQKGMNVANIIASVNTPWNEALFATLYHDILHGWLKNGSIKPNRLEVIPGGLAGIPAALARLENNEVSGMKLVFCPHEIA